MSVANVPHTPIVGVVSSLGAIEGIFKHTLNITVFVYAIEGLLQGLDDAEDTIVVASNVVWVNL